MYQPGATPSVVNLLTSIEDLDITGCSISSNKQLYGLLHMFAFNSYILFPAYTTKAIAPSSCFNVIRLFLPNI